MGKKFADQRNYSVNINYFADMCRNIGNTDLRLSFQSENPTNDGGVWFRILHGMSMASYGEKITITLTPITGGTNVHILSECGMPTQLIDYGKNQSNVNVIFNYLESGMPQPGVYTSPAAAPAPARQVDPASTDPAPNCQPGVSAPAQSATPAQDFYFCPNCGRKNHADSNFCAGCGRKLK